MPKFVFRYEVLLRHRRDVEDERQRELATKMRGRMIMTDQLRTMQGEISESKHRLGASLVGKVDLSKVGEFTRYNAAATARGRELVKRLAEVEGEINAARDRLAEAMRQRKALELLREKDLADWKRKEDRRETAELDELAMQAYTRGLIGGAA